MEDKRICKQCLLRDIPEDEFFKGLYRHIQNIDEDIKTPAKEYEYRLSLCKECDSLLNGMCRICGCFVEMRAAVSKNYCPAILKRW